MKNYVTNSNNRLDIYRAWLVYTDIHRTTMLKTVPSEKEMRIIIQYHLHKLITHTYKTHMPFSRTWIFKIYIKMVAYGGENGIAKRG